MENKIYCSRCGSEMNEGYDVHDGIYNYCSDECLNAELGVKEYLELYDQGYAFWTTFED